MEEIRALQSKNPPLKFQIRMHVLLSLYKQKTNNHAWDVWIKRVQLYVQQSCFNRTIPHVFL